MSEQQRILCTPPACEDDRIILETAMEAGHILLENGAEIARVEETMRRISRTYGVENSSFFVLSNGIFTTGGRYDGPSAGQFARVRHIPVHGSQLDKVVAVNQLSREIEENKHTLEETREILRQIRQMPTKKPWLQMAASGVGSACFCILFGGSLMDAVTAMIAGLVLYALILWVFPKRMSKLLMNILGGMTVTAVCLLLHRLGLGENMSHTISGAIIPLVPGVAFTNGVRDLANGDYISGSVRLLDAILMFVCIAVGVALTVMLYQRLTGGAFL